MSRMGIESVEKEFDYRVIEITRTGTYKVPTAIDVAEGTLKLVTIETGEAEPSVKAYEGTGTQELIVGVIKESVKANGSAMVIKKGKVDKKALEIPAGNLTAQEIYEIMEHQGLFAEEVSERQKFLGGK